MAIYKIPDTNIQIEWSGDLNEKKRILSSYGITYIPTTAELAAETRRVNAQAEAKLATELRSLTPAQAVAYIESNVTTLATAKTVLKIMVRLLIALRDETWPNLPEE
jgi:hypothetical protein